MTALEAVAYIGIALIVAFVADRIALLRRSGGERGDYWTAVVRRLSWVLLPALYLSAASRVYPRLWQTGYHLHFDLSGTHNWPRELCFTLAFWLPWLVWGLLLIYGWLEKPRGREAGRWLAGSVGLGSSRAWVLLCTLPLIAALAFTTGDLRNPPWGQSAATWSTIVVLVASLVGVAFSTGRTVAKGPSPLDDNDAPPPLPSWPEAMRAGGIELEHLSNWPADPPPRAVRGERARQLAQRLERSGARDVAPELVEAVEALLHPGSTGDEHGPARLVFAPEACGQVEIVAAAAGIVEQRFRATTLVIVASDAEALYRQIEPWMPPGRHARVLRSEVDAETTAALWIADAETLSHRLLPVFKSRRLINRLGLVVWWGLETYTGVLGANLWAISRRLHRLIRLAGRADDVRTLALARRAAHPDAQIGEFVGRLLPHVFPPETTVFVEPRSARPIQLHRLRSQQRLLANGNGGSQATLAPHPILGALRISADTGWPTLFEPPLVLTDAEIEPVLQLPSGNATVRERMVTAAPEAGARLLHIVASDALSFTDIIVQGGRNDAPGQPHHIALTVDLNPYLEYLLSQLATSKGRPPVETARRLVCAAAHRDVLRHHLLLALNEHSDTRQGLLRNFRLDEATVQATLREIAHRGDLSQKEVRSLDDRQRLVIDQRYESRHPPEDGERPLDVVGGDLVRVLDRAVGHQDGGIRMLLDPERVTIQAYPHRRFLYRGRRYRINVWESLAGVAAPRELDCEQDAVLSWTWRIRNLAVFGLEPAGSAFSVGRGGRLLSCLPVDLWYEEEVTGVVRLVSEAEALSSKPEILRLPRELATSFATRGLVLRFPEEGTGLELRSLSQALRHVLPVHLGVEDDALEVVPLRGERIEHWEVFGLAIVDLYPRGIGLVDAIRNDADFLLKLLAHTRAWLESAADDCLHTPAALAANLGDPPRRRAALDLLAQVM